MSDPTSFASDIRQLFTQKDVACMAGHNVLLDSYDYMADRRGNDQYADLANARQVFDRVSGRVLPRMPKGSPPWSAAQVDLLAKWISDGCPP
jgi:hypothetical protein